MILKHYMKDVISVKASTTVREAASLIIEKRAGTLPVVDDNNTLIGVVRLPNLLKVFMPNFVSLLDNIDFVVDFGSLEELHFKDIPEIENITMKKIMEKPVLIYEDCGLLRAFAIMDKYNFMDLLIVDKKSRLVGIASRVDIAAGFLSASMNGGTLT
ncbi:MAG TPA: CBS domain-containing protein [Candidatus Eremiobacteraeota bacterium]|nr:MAG: inosine 5'-monophosphate dehydrogenase [bacterium ADurb.Bin363]HPZ09308.1 CBS domain-containing protein [Candidatus Eremiobacteraeota bacterium]